VTPLGSVEAAGKRIGRVLFNAFVPGSLLYNRVSAERGTAADAFEAVVRQYRDMPVKPALPEEARKFKVQAAVRYFDALKIAPWWPEGHFNRALLLGEAGNYEKAVVEMRKYLMLVPEAPDARAAQDKIYGWGAFPEGGKGR